MECEAVYVEDRSVYNALKKLKQKTLLTPQEHTEKKRFAIAEYSKKAR